MNKHHNFRFCISLGFALALAGGLYAQNAPNKTLVVNGKSVDTTVRQIDGHSYVDVETLAELTNGTVFIEPNRVVLTIPASSTTPAPPSTTPVAAASSPVAATPNVAAVPVVGPVGVATPVATSAAAAEAPAAAAVPAAAPAPAVVQPPSGLSRTFASTAIATVADMREWRGAISAMITHGLALGDEWAQSYRDQTQEDLAQAEVAATTDADRSAVQLLRNEADNLTSWSNSVLAARANLNGASTIDPDALKNDTALAKIRSCSQFLNSMLVSGAFTDDASCH
ncbi:MAG TPA: hypothetical protein VN861_05995 [Candidatus Acidoferrales bacterium]|nr:hypothetical protein [Candidatus Acidoferrales bacterium]